MYLLQKKAVFLCCFCLGLWSKTTLSASCDGFGLEMWSLKRDGPWVGTLCSFWLCRRAACYVATKAWKRASVCECMRCERQQGWCWIPISWWSNSIRWRRDITEPFSIWILPQQAMWNMCILVQYKYCLRCCWCTCCYVHLLHQGVNLNSRKPHPPDSDSTVPLGFWSAPIKYNMVRHHLAPKTSQ